LASINKIETMKQIIAITTSLIHISFAFGQGWSTQFQINFEDNVSLHQLFIDTNENPNNIWQIGPPQKSIFDSSYSMPNVIVTDTINYYPVNDTSSFTIKTIADLGYIWPHAAAVGAAYKVNSDSLNDYGLIEFSPDNGNTWIDLLNDTIYDSYFYWMNPWGKPTLTGNSNGWKVFAVDVAYLGPLFNIQQGDTVQFKFTFISDSIADTLDGLMFDSFSYLDFVSSVEEHENLWFTSKAFPNPTNGKLKIDFAPSFGSALTLTVYDNTGKELFFMDKIKESTIDLSVEEFPSGAYSYLLEYPNERKRSWGRFIVTSY
jgi:hypothetical protein